MTRDCPLAPVTVADCERVLLELPDLTASGFDSYYVDLHARQNASRAHNGLPPKYRHHPIPITDLDMRRQTARARLFLTTNCRPTKGGRRRRGSYGLKHEAEQWIGRLYPAAIEVPYICNGAFIAALWLAGYVLKRDGPNAWFHMSFTPEYRRFRDSVQGGLRTTPPEGRRICSYDGSRHFAAQQP